MVTLDLNNWRIDRILWDSSNPYENGYVIGVFGKLNLTGPGVVTGGFNAGNGGGVYVAEGGVFTMNDGVSIEFNKTLNGGGGCMLQGEAFSPCPVVRFTQMKLLITAEGCS